LEAIAEALEEKEAGGGHGGGNVVIWPLGDPGMGKSWENHGTSAVNGVLNGKAMGASSEIGLHSWGAGKNEDHMGFRNPRTK